MRNKCTIKSEEDIHNIIDKYVNQNIKIEDIAKEYHCRESKISQILKQNNIQTTWLRRSASKGIVEDYFDNIDTETKAYLLGFIMADGSVRYESDRRNNRGTLRLEIKLEDEYIIDLLLNELRCCYKKSYRTKDNSNTVSVSITNTKIVDSLVKYGVVQNKTYFAKCLYLNFCDDILKAYLRGYFDGNGCLYECKNSYHAAICSGVYELTESFQLVIDKNIGIDKHTKITYGSAFRAQWNGINCAKLCKYLYCGANIYLHRKYKIANKVIENYKNNT